MFKKRNDSKVDKFMEVPVFNNVDKQKETKELFFIIRK